MGGYRHNIKTPRTGNERRQTNPNKTVCIIFIGYIHILYKLRSVQNTGTCYPGQSWFVRNLTGVPDKSSRGLGSMSRYSAQILICFIAFIFLFFFHSSVGLVGNFAGLPVCTLPSAIVHCNQNEAGLQTIKAPSMPCWSAAGWSKHSQAVTAWWKWQIKWMKSVSIGSFQHKNQVNGETLAYLWVILLYSSLEVRLRLFWNWLGQESDSCHIAVKLEFESIFQAV